MTTKQHARAVADTAFTASDSSVRLGNVLYSAGVLYSYHTAVAVVSRQPGHAPVAIATTQELSMTTTRHVHAFAYSASEHGVRVFHLHRHRYVAILTGGLDSADWPERARFAFLQDLRDLCQDFLCNLRRDGMLRTEDRRTLRRHVEEMAEFCGLFGLEVPEVPADEPEQATQYARAVEADRRRIEEIAEEAARAGVRRRRRNVLATARRWRAGESVGKETLDQAVSYVRGDPDPDLRERLGVCVRVEGDEVVSLLHGGVGTLADVRAMAPRILALSRARKTTPWSAWEVDAPNCGQLLRWPVTVARDDGSVRIGCTDVPAAALEEIAKQLGVEVPA